MKRPVSKIGFLALTAFALHDKYLGDDLLLRNLRTLYSGAKLVYHYKVSLNESNISDIHQIVAQDLFNLCKYNDGLYVKFGQQIASGDHLLPPIYCRLFTQLQDQAKSTQFQQVEEIVKQELGTDIQSVFQEFDREPIASASIAQVHKGRLKDGRLVAIKIQKPNIKGQFGWDMYMHWLFCAVIEKLFDLPIMHFHQSIEDNLRKEIDFRIEASNANRCKQAFLEENRQDVYIPQIHESLTTKRLMVMEYVEGVKVTDQKSLKDMGISIKAVAHTVVDMFAQQIFVTGFVHADPHPGNLLVRKHPFHKGHQVILLDFGLCIELSPELRKQYSLLWKSIFTHDTSTLNTLVKSWGIGDTQMFANMTLQRPYKKGKSLLRDYSSQETYQMQLQLKQDAKKLLGDTHLFPDELLFVGRNMNLVRSINKSLCSPVNRIQIMANKAVKGLSSQNSFWQRIHIGHFRLRIFMFDIFYLVYDTVLRWTTGHGFEDQLDLVMQKQIQEQYAKYGMKLPDKDTFNA